MFSFICTVLLLATRSSDASQIQFLHDIAEQRTYQNEIQYYRDAMPTPIHAQAKSRFCGGVPCMPPSIYPEYRPSIPPFVPTQIVPQRPVSPHAIPAPYLNSMIYPVAAPYPVVNSCPSADPYPVAYPYPVIKPSAALCPCVGPPAILPGQSDMPCILSYDIWDSLLPNKCPCPCMMCRTNNKQRKFELLQKLTNSKVPVVMDCH